MSSSLFFVSIFFLRTIDLKVFFALMKLPYTIGSPGNWRTSFAKCFSDLQSLLKSILSFLGFFGLRYLMHFKQESAFSIKMFDRSSQQRLTPFALNL